MTCDMPYSLSFPASLFLWTLSSFPVLSYFHYCQFLDDVLNAIKNMISSVKNYTLTLSEMSLPVYIYSTLSSYSFFHPLTNLSLSTMY